jgi:hypothetical protein
MAGSTFPGGGYAGEYSPNTPSGVLNPAAFRIVVSFPAGLPFFLPSRSPRSGGPVPTFTGEKLTLGITPFGGIRPNTLSIVDAVGQVQTCDVEIEDKRGERGFSIHAPFHIQEGLSTLFYGDIDEVEVSSLESPYDVDAAGRHTHNPTGARVFKLRGTGLSHLATRKLTGAFSAQVKVPITTVVSAIAAPLGVSLSISTAGNLVLPDTFLSEQETIGDALTRLADLCTTLSNVIHIWTIDYPGTSFSTPTLFFYPVTGRAATSALGATGYPIKSGSIRVRTTREQFANSAVLKLDRYLKGGGAAQTDNKTGADIFSGTLTLTSPLASEPTIKVNNVEETVGIKDSDTGKDWYWSLGSNVLRVGDSGAGGSDTIDVTYLAHDLRSVTVTDSASAAAVGLFQIPVQTPDTGNTASPTAVAQMALGRRNGLTTEITLTALTPSGAFKAGQFIPVYLSGFGSTGRTPLAGLYYCKSIRTYDQDLTILWREFTLLGGPLLMSPVAYLRGL